MDYLLPALDTSDALEKRIKALREALNDIIYVNSPFFDDVVSIAEAALKADGEAGKQPAPASE